MYQRGTPEFEHHVQLYGPQSRFGYKDFIPRFTAEKFDAREWAALFRGSGARFVVPVAEHHDGFPLYDCSFTEWSAAKMGPQRDLIGELAEAVRAEELCFGVSSHRAEHWWFFDGGRQFDSDVPDPRFAGLYGPAHPWKTPDGKKDTRPAKAFLDDWLARTAELVDRYRPQLVWFDWWIGQPAFEPYLRRFAAFYYNRAAEWNQEVAINYKNQAFPEGVAVLDIERGKLDTSRPRFWQTDTSIGLKSWGYIENEEFRSADSLVDDLVDIISKNGALLLNIGPRADGTIPDQVWRTLLELGGWLRVNGEAIYGTRPWKVFGEGPTKVLEGGFTDARQEALTGRDIRYTTRGNTLYAVVLDWPGETAILNSVTPANLDGRQVVSIRLLGAAGELAWKQAPDQLLVTMPRERPCDFAFTLRIELQ